MNRIFEAIISLQVSLLYVNLVLSPNVGIYQKFHQPKATQFLLFKSHEKK